MSVFEELQSIKEKALSLINETSDLNELNKIKADYLGKKGPISAFMQQMGSLSQDERPKFGAMVNSVKNALEEAVDTQKKVLENEAIKKALESQTIDVTMPGRKINIGTSHILSITKREIEDLFIGMGYRIAEGPEVETDENNFEKLNLPKGHPARDMQDSLYINPSLLLRTHTSPVQVRAMQEANGEPIRVICPGKVYRRDDDDATHSHQFMQIEGLVIGENISLADLKGTLLAVARKMFGEEREIRLRPSYFPFTEPSVEVDVSCAFCGGKGCPICKGTGWIEVLGAGIVNKNVLDMSGYDSDKLQGFAFGIGVERIAMLKHGIDDIRNFYINDIRFIEQFKEVK